MSKAWPVTAESMACWEITPDLLILRIRLPELLIFQTHKNNEQTMSAHIYKKIEVVGSSETSIEEAVNNAVAKASESVRNMRWLEIVETRCHIEEQKVAYWQVTVKIGFTLDDN
jgi:dodecin